MNDERCADCARKGVERTVVATIHDARGCFHYCSECAVRRLTTTSLMFGGVCACEKQKVGHGG